MSICFKIDLTRQGISCGTSKLLVLLAKDAGGDQAIVQLAQPDQIKYVLAYQNQSASVILAVANPDM